MLCTGIIFTFFFGQTYLRLEWRYEECSWWYYFFLGWDA